MAVTISRKPLVCCGRPDGGGKDEREDVGESQANDETGGNSEGRVAGRAKQSHDGNPQVRARNLRGAISSKSRRGKPSDGKGDENNKVPNRPGAQYRCRTAP